ncbi:MAG: hypothetical protein ABI625_17940 [bacterium]
MTGTDDLHGPTSDTVGDVEPKGPPAGGGVKFIRDIRPAALIIALMMDEADDTVAAGKVKPARRQGTRTRHGNAPPLYTRGHALVECGTNPVRESKISVQATENARASATILIDTQAASASLADNNVILSRPYHV